jgi:NADH-quinone oxidoreductase subunit I
VTFKDLTKTIFLTEILKALVLTFKAFISKPVTRQYPEEKRESLPGFRGLHALVRESSTGQEKCIACGLCGAICPARCIHIYSAEASDGTKYAERYEIDVLRCIYCALCVEACPVQAISLTEHYEYADYSREALYMTKEKLLDNWDKFMAGEKGTQYFEKFYHPTAADFTSYEGQAVFRGKLVEKEQRDVAA